MTVAAPDTDWVPAVIIAVPCCCSGACSVICDTGIGFPPTAEK